MLLKKKKEKTQEEKRKRTKLTTKKQTVNIVHDVFCFDDEKHLEGNLIVIRCVVH